MTIAVKAIKRDLSVSNVGVRALIGACLGIALIGPVAATPMHPAAATELLQLDLQNELILGTPLSPMAAACLSEQSAGGWVIPSKPGLEISDRAQQRKQRARERCNAAISGVSDLEAQRKISEAMHEGFAGHLEARLALEATKKHARACLTDRKGEADFKRCMKSNPTLAPDESTWPRWMELFVRYTTLK